MRIDVSETPERMSHAAAAHAAAALRQIIAAQGRARIVVATAASQIGFQRALAALPDIDWASVELFQLDEYIGLPATHPACFRQLLHEHVITPTGIRDCHLLDGMDAARSIARTSAAISAAPIDLAFLGIGENAHLAFNDPPADFSTSAPYIEVRLDEVCRQQQVGEGWFARLDEVPATAITMSITQILQARELLVIVPDARKAAAVRATLASEISPSVPASILRTHPAVTLYLDVHSRGLVSGFPT